jgi:ribosomal protein S18 acetylase RimI-like enzyme
MTPSGVLRRQDDLVETCEAMYAIPRGEGGFRPALAAHATRDGFRLCAASDTNDGRMLGFGYGFTGRPGQLWRDEMARAVPQHVADEWLDGHFEFAEFGVIPSARRRGIGTLLHAAVFDGLPHRRAVLTVREGNAPAIAFYKRHGWRTLHEGFVAAEGHGPYVIMGRLLDPARRRPGDTITS